MVDEWMMRVTDPFETAVPLSLSQVPLVSSSLLSRQTVWQLQWMKKGFVAYRFNYIIYSGEK